MSVGRALTWVGASDTQVDRSRLNQLAQAIELLEVAVVGAHERGREPDAPLWSALKPAHCSECAAVAHGGNGTLAEHDSAQGIIRVVQSKGQKDRNVMLPPEVLALLRQWWCERPRRYNSCLMGRSSNGRLAVT